MAWDTPNPYVSRAAECFVHTGHSHRCVGHSPETRPPNRRECRLLAPDLRWDGLPMRRQLITRMGAGVLLLTGLFAGSVPAQAGAANYRVDWTPCADNPSVHCGTLQVPLDWSKPRGE